MGKEKNMLSDPLDHAPELLTLLKALAKNDIYDELIRKAKIKQKEGEIMTFPSLFEEEFKRGVATGVAQTEARVRQEERQIIRDRLIAKGMSPQEAANLTGLSA